MIPSERWLDMENPVAKQATNRRRVERSKRSLTIDYHINWQLMTNNDFFDEETVKFVGCAQHINNQGSANFQSNVC
jgi:hypothetical protein